jgi:hypothetical protein
MVSSWKGSPEKEKTRQLHPGGTGTVPGNTGTVYSSSTTAVHTHARDYLLIMEKYNTT